MQILSVRADDWEAAVFWPGQPLITCYYALGYSSFFHYPTVGSRPMEHVHVDSKTACTTLSCSSYRMESIKNQQQTMQVCNCRATKYKAVEQWFCKCPAVQLLFRHLTNWHADCWSLSFYGKANLNYIYYWHLGLNTHLQVISQLSTWAWPKVCCGSSSPIYKKTDTALTQN